MVVVVLVRFFELGWGARTNVEYGSFRCPLLQPRHRQRLRAAETVMMLLTTRTTYMREQYQPYEGGRLG